jgi:putative membrane-bound dehydrogenase-like protein
VSWAAGEAAQQARQRLALPDVSYVDGYNVPNYERKDPAPRFQVPFAPEDATKFIVAPADFDLQLFASEPDAVKAIAMQFDERGRLWILEARDYPNVVLNGAQGGDQIKILEDTNNDGKADKSTIWAQGINIGSGFVFANGGVIVAAAPHMLFFKDTNGDDKADTREILNTGWGTNDTHAVASSLTNGMDNYIYGTVGYSGFRGNMNGKPMDFSQGSFRFKPDGSAFEYLGRATNNTWGIGLNETGDIFGSTANGDPSWYLGIPNRYFENAALLGPGAAADVAGRGRGGAAGYASIAEFTAVHYLTPYIRQVDQMDSYTAGAGHNIYTARSFPKSYWNRIAFVNEPTVHITGQIVLEPTGAGYTGRDAWNLAASADEWFAPVHSMVGPDGAVWISDWYNFIIQHNPTPTEWGYVNGRGNAYETSMRDRSRGRIYRIAYKGAPAAPKRSLSKNDPAGLVAALSFDNMFWRLTAQRLLVERGQKDVVPQLLALARSRTMDEIGINGGAMHALWTLQGLGELNDTTTEAYQAAVEALKNPAAGVRKAAAQVLPKAPAASDAILAANLVADANLHTRLAAVLELSQFPSSPAVAQAVFKASHEPQNFNDPWLSRALYLAAAKHKDPFLQAYNADRAKLPFSALSVPLRMGNLTPDWRTPSTTELSAEWSNMTLPNNWEAAGLPGFDGFVWFARTFDVGATAAMPTSLSLGTVRNQAQVWLNGTPLVAEGAGAGRGAGGGGGRGTPPPPPAPGQVAQPVNPPQGARTQQLTFQIPAGLVKRGANTISVRVNNSRAEGGLVGPSTDMFLTDGQARTSLAGPWKYRVERSVSSTATYTKPGELAAHVAFVAGGGLASAAAAALPTVTAVPDVTLTLGVIPGEMKFNLPQLSVQAGQMVELVFVNSDQMQHNVVIGTQGSLEVIGAAADQMATRPGAIAQSYVPDIAQVIAKSPLVEPGQTFRFQFRAPTEVGQYPYICTFPAHWRVMNGVLNVTAPPAGRGGGGGGRQGGQGAAPAAPGRGAGAPTTPAAPPAGGRGQ